jgi:hypothetical protein
MRKSIFALALMAYSCLLIGQQKQFQAELKTVSNRVMTDSIQFAIDKCAASGGGVVRLIEGTFICGGIQLKSKVTLHLSKGVILQGSDKYSDYKNDAFIFGKDLTGVTIEGEGIIDGVDCYNPKGEEGFRGPHCIKLINCSDIKLEGITIINSANWAINCRYCSGGIVTNVTIRGGHDGLHTRFCDNFKVKGCDFRTGDDAFAGNDNRNFDISACFVNTSCNGFRLGCMNLTVSHCRIWGPGESVHKIQNRNNMLSAFVHFSPKDENPVLQSGNWTIEDIWVQNVDNFFIYNFENGLWQTGQPFTSVTFDGIRAYDILNAFYIRGDSAQNFNMNLKNSSFAYRRGEVKKNDVFEGVKLKSGEFFYANSFNSISLENVTFEKGDYSALLKAENGKELSLYNVGFIWLSVDKPFIFNRITDIKKNIYYNSNYDPLFEIDIDPETL